MKQKQLIATGRLDWDSTERVTSRYGYINLSPKCKPLARLEYNVRGKLYAEVVEPRESWTHGYPNLPPTPEIGQVECLGEGLLEIYFDVLWYYGLKPLDGRTEEWLNEEALCVCHNCDVNLYFEPTE